MSKGFRGVRVYGLTLIFLRLHSHADAQARQESHGDPAQTLSEQKPANEHKEKTSHPTPPVSGCSRHWLNTARRGGKSLELGGREEGGEAENWKLRTLDGCKPLEDVDGELGPHLHRTISLDHGAAAARTYRPPWEHPSLLLLAAGRALRGVLLPRGGLSGSHCGEDRASR